MRSKAESADFFQHASDGAGNDFRIYGFEKSLIKTVLTCVICLLTGGFGFLVLYWRIDWRIRCTYRYCLLERATVLLCRDAFSRFSALYPVRKVFDSRGDIRHVETGDIKPAKMTYISQVQDAEHMVISLKQPRSVLTFIFRKIHFVWDPDKKEYVRLRALEENVSCEELIVAKPLTEDQRIFRQKLYGANSVETGLTPWYEILFKSILSKFYIFQLASCILWFFDEYALYASVILGFSVCSVILGLYEAMKNERDVHALSVSSGSAEIVVERDGGQTERRWVKIDELVPGDLLLIRQQMCMPCDAVLLDGNALVDESKLTGESIPVTKTAISNEAFLPSVIFNVREHSRHILFSGTTVIQTRYASNTPLRVVVIRSGFNTLRGELIRSILYPKPVLYEYEKDVNRFIKALATVTTLGMLYTLVIKIRRKDPATTIIKRCLDLITICVPPALPIALLAGTVRSQKRLKDKKIYCLSQHLINISGTVDTVVFDKTGTLTEDGLDLSCVVACRTPLLIEGDGKPQQKYFMEPAKKASDIQADNEIIPAMAACHTLTRINNELAGDPIDLNMFKFTNWTLLEPDVGEGLLFGNMTPTLVQSPDKTKEVGIIKIFPFVSHLQRMSVVTRDSKGDRYEFLCKGSPEKIVELCLPDTVPADINQILDRFTREGYRVIAISKRILSCSFRKLMRLGRDQLEKDVEFLGLIVLENKLKPETEQVVWHLKTANLRQIMCTGDNLLTAVSVARNCKMIDPSTRIVTISCDDHNTLQFDWDCDAYETLSDSQESEKREALIEFESCENFCFAVDGYTWSLIREHHEKAFNALLVKGAIFARMLPEMKQHLIESLIQVGYSVVMCGDGANDCGALKAASTAISLSATEASVASPFTSMIQNISCVPLLISEGRCALVTSFGTIKFLCIYSLVQFLSITILYAHGAILGDRMFLYIDVGLLAPLTFAFSYAKPVKQLWWQRPPLKLFCVSSCASLAIQMALAFSFEYLASRMVIDQPWFQAAENGGVTNDYFVGYIVSGVFLVSNLQYITHSVIFSRGHPHRGTIWSNWQFLIALVVTSFASIWLIVSGGDKFTEFMQIRIFPRFEFRLLILLVSLLGCILMFAAETFLFEYDGFVRKHKRHFARLREKLPRFLSKEEPPFVQIERELKLSPSCLRSGLQNESCAF